MSEQFAPLLKRLANEAWVSRHRRCLVLAGDREWCLERAASLCDLAQTQPIWVGEPATAPDGFEVIAHRLARGLLGRQTYCVVADCWDGVDPNIIGALSGIVEGGGLLVLIRRPWGDDTMGAESRRRLAVLPFEVEDVSHHFTTRFWECIGRSSGTAVLDARRGLLTDTESGSAPVEASRFIHDVAKTADQRDALAAVLKVAVGRRRRPLVLVSDRGRGKSSVLGLAAGELLRDRDTCILLIAPSRAAVSPVFEHAQRVWHQGAWRGDTLGDATRNLSLAVPSELVGELPKADLVLVDEAAALPVALLRRVLDRYSRVVFSTTIHGYEGTGRGFSIRFQQYLEERTPDWRYLTMQEPVRWASGCPVEAAVFDALALDAGPAEISSEESVGELDPMEYMAISRERLVENDSELRQVFGILVAAHYRTSPADLQRMMDAPNLMVFAALRNGTVYGAALVAAEGRLPTDISRDIFLGRRRPLGHLLPETLEAYTGLAGASELAAWRVVRVAVHPDAQERGIGSALVHHIFQAAQSQDIAYVGAAFGATPRLLSFWLELGFDLSRLGVKRGASSGLYSAVMLKPISQRGTQFVGFARSRFTHGVVGNLSGPWQSLEVEVIEALIEHGQEGTVEALGIADLMDVAGFAAGARPFEVVFDSVLRFARSLLHRPDIFIGLPIVERHIVIRLLLQGWSWRDVGQELGVSGRVGVIKHLRNAMRCALSSNTDERVRELLHTIENTSK